MDVRPGPGRTGSEMVRYTPASQPDKQGRGDLTSFSKKKHDEQEEEEEEEGEERDSEDDAPVQPTGADDAPLQPTGVDDAPAEHEMPSEPHSETYEATTEDFTDAHEVQSTPRENYKKTAQRGASPMAIDKKRKLSICTTPVEEPCSVTSSNLDARNVACEEEVLPAVFPQIPIKLTRSKAREMTILASNTRSKKAKSRN
ncbi:hypothetical protein D1007_48007 [Hordeum vulgare]|nr:hypothetical protein D1007_48007 [Hordeum vulgare]